MTERSPRRARPRRVVATYNLDELLRQLARDIDQALRSEAGPHSEVTPMTTATRRRVMTQVDSALGRLYPTARGGRSLYGDQLLGQSADRWATVLRQEALALQTLLGAALVAAILADDDPDNDLAALLAFAFLPAPERQAAALRLSDTATWRDPAGRPLSDRIWNTRTATRRAVDLELRTAIRDRRPIGEVATRLEQYLTPSARQGRGNGTHAARRLVRYELDRARGEAVNVAAQRNPFTKGVQWVLNPAHPRRDHCDVNATQDRFGLGPGIYAPGQTPRYPDHPHCGCYLRPVNVGVRDIITGLRERFGLGGGGGNAQFTSF